MISCIMPTWRRMHCVERSASLFCAQDDKSSHLVIFNTDEENPVVLGNSFDGERIVVINNNIDYKTGLPYSNVGAIRRDSLSHANQKYYICWDDDDIFLPWNNRQCLDNIVDTDLWAWKPFSSMAKIYRNPEEISQNFMEASIISLVDKIKEVGYAPHLGGGEHLQWYNYFQDKKKMKIDKESIPAYSFNWSDGPAIGGHKNSGSIKDQNNFERHKAGCKDIHTRPIEKIDISDIIKPYISLLKDSIGSSFKGHEIKNHLYEKYAKKYER